MVIHMGMDDDYTLITLQHEKHWKQSATRPRGRVHHGSEIGHNGKKMFFICLMDIIYLEQTMERRKKASSGLGKPTAEQFFFSSSFGWLIKGLSRHRLRTFDGRKKSLSMAFLRFCFTSSQSRDFNLAPHDFAVDRFMTNIFGMLYRGEGIRG